jgi:hypothetical protein
MMDQSTSDLEIQLLFTNRGDSQLGAVPSAPGCCMAVDGSRCRVGSAEGGAGTGPRQVPPLDLAWPTCDVVKVARWPPSWLQAFCWLAQLLGQVR